MKLLSVNAGSSSLKFRVYEMPEEKLLMKGMFERIGLEGSSYNLRIGEEKVQKEADIKNHKDAVDILLEELLKEKIVKDLSEIKAVGHRVVHGGNFYSHSVKISARALIEIEELSDLVGLERIKLITPDGPANYLRTVLNQMDKEEFEFFIKYHLATCERRELIGAAAHTVDILRKV